MFGTEDQRQKSSSDKTEIMKIDKKCKKFCLAFFRFPYYTVQVKEMLKSRGMKKADRMVSGSEVNYESVSYD